MNPDVIRFLAFDLGLPLACAIAAYAGVRFSFARRLKAQEEQVGALAQAIGEALDLQTSGYEKLSSRLADLESRMLDVGTPAADAAPLPLERRHRVLALARKGVALDEIVRRLDIPRGEAELILRMRNYLDGKP